MEIDYRCSSDFWNQVFSGENDAIPLSKKLDNDVLDDAISWLCEGSSFVLDFGCGNGMMLFLCALYGTNEHLGIDLSKEAILCARRNAARMPAGRYDFQEGGVEALQSVPNSSYDAVILSNIVDNLYPEDGLALLKESARILKDGGKTLVKLNPYITPEQIVEWNIKPISGNLLDDGLLLWNNSTEQWREIFSAQFAIVCESEVYYPEHEQTNRLFLLKK